MVTQDIKQHYNHVARNRHERLLSKSYNVWQFNHDIRERIIRKFIGGCGPLDRGIDIGTGTGVWAEILSEYCSNVDGIDFAEENIRIASKNAKNLEIDNRLSYSVCDAQTLIGIPDKYYNVATQVSVLQHIPDQNECIRRISNILDTNGYLILLVHNRKCIYNRNLVMQRKSGGQVSVNEYSTLPEIKKILSDSGFDILHVRFSWLFLNDFLFLGKERWYLKPFNPIRLILISAFSQIDLMLGRLCILNIFFREIVLIARKIS